MATSSSMKENLEKRWIQLTSGIDADVQTKWWKTIVSKYEEPERKYHTLTHLYKMFEHLDSNAENISSIKALSYAIFFHDLEYNAQSQTNEEDSTELFQKYCIEADIATDEELVSKVNDLIQLSKTHCTDAHKNEAIYGTDDSHYFLDFDVSILGAEPEEYKEYAKQIREEYQYLPAMKYNFLRTKVLKLFLQIPNIFATKIFRDQYEEKARNNIKAEISQLDNDAGDS